MKPNKPNNDWLAALEKVIGSTSSKPGPEWKTRRQLEAELGVGRRTIENALRGLVESGRADVKKFTMGEIGSRRVIPHYRLK